MPRDGSGVYSAPAGTNPTTLTTIESAKYIAFIADLVNDLNTARPITAGGTGGVTAAAARAALGIPFGNAEVIKTNDYNVTTADAGFPLIFNKATSIVANLPSLASAGIVPYFIQNIGAGDLTIDPNASETIIGGTTLVLKTGDSVLIWPNGSIWRVVPFRLTAQSFGGFAMINGKITTSVGSSALTIAIKTFSGNDPSVNDPVYVAFRNATATTGDYTIIAITAATSLVISSGSTMGFSSASFQRLWVVGFNDAGTFRLGAVNARSGNSIMALRDDILASSTAEGGAGAADSAQVIYTGTAVTAKAMRILAYIDFTLTTAGTWDEAGDKLQLFGPGVAKPGEVLQRWNSETGASSTGTTVLPADNTIPQSTEGDQYFSQPITPGSAANLLEIEHQGFYSSSTTINNMTAALFQDAGANAIRALSWVTPANGVNTNAIFMIHRMLAALAVATTFKIRTGGNVAGTTRINGQVGGTQLYNGVGLSSLEVREIMA